eukprot:366439-Chlamydomonas_euryale.AAC.3
MGSWHTVNVTRCRTLTSHPCAARPLACWSWRLGWHTASRYPSVYKPQTSAALPRVHAAQRAASPRRLQR